MPAAAPTTSITLDELLLIARLSNSLEPGDHEEARNQRARAFFAMLTGHLPDEAAVLLAKAMHFHWLLEKTKPLRDEVMA